MTKPAPSPLEAALLRERLESYVRLTGGYPVPLAGAIYWGVLGLIGERAELATWANAAFLGSGAIFPLALLLARIFRNPFMKDRTAVTSVLLPTFVSMLLFWAMIFAAAREGTSLIPLILAVGMSLHWPVIGWSYGRTGLFTAHAVLRTVLAAYIWAAWPEHRLTFLPYSVAAIYCLTVIAILIDANLVRRRLARS